MAFIQQTTEKAKKILNKGFNVIKTFILIMVSLYLLFIGFIIYAIGILAIYHMITGNYLIR